MEKRKKDKIGRGKLRLSERGSMQCDIGGRIEQCPKAKNGRTKKDSEHQITPFGGEGRIQR
jgi:hypothetical protein